MNVFAEKFPGKKASKPLNSATVLLKQMPK